MKTLGDARILWKSTFAHVSSLSDLKAAVRDDNPENPCRYGLRSVCWKAFLLFENLDRSTWPKTLKNSRSAYAALREHFLREIDTADELSATDPLADDDSSPWNAIRRDEILRDEISLDIERCMPNNLYFREPTTQSTLLDILFIFCKLNADIGYRQGMHELLAPVLWVTTADAVDSEGFSEEPGEKDQADELLLDTLNHSYIEHDAFTIFCLIMQTAKTFYELGAIGQQTTTAGLRNSPIVERSKRIHENYLRKADPQLAGHLTSIDILPQIFVIRWIRLLFGREFPFDDVLCLWDLLFAEDPTLDLVDYVCVAMLLRVRWQLLEADYSSALTILLRYPIPPDPYGPPTFIDDAMYLRKNFSEDGASHLIHRYSGKLPNSSTKIKNSSRRQRGSNTGGKEPKDTSGGRSALRSPAQYVQDQGGIETLLQEAAKGVYSRGEKWGLGKALRGAVQGLQSGNSSPRNFMSGARWSLDDGRVVAQNAENIDTRTQTLDKRNKALAQMLQTTVDDLLVQQKKFEEEKADSAADALGLVIARMQFVQVYLEDSALPLIPEDSAGKGVEHESAGDFTPTAPVETASKSIDKEAPPTSRHHRKTSSLASDSAAPPSLPAIDDSIHPGRSASPTPRQKQSAADLATHEPDAHSTTPAPLSNKDMSRTVCIPFHQSRPSLAQSSFSWMLGEDQRRASFVSANPLEPEKRRENASRAKAGYLFGDEDRGKKGVGRVGRKPSGKRSSSGGGNHGEADGPGEDDRFALGTLVVPSTKEEDGDVRNG